MVRRVANVEVTSPDGTKSPWVVALPHSEAVAAVRKVIPPITWPNSQSAVCFGSQKKLDGLRPGEVLNCGDTMDDTCVRNSLHGDDRQ
jgi:hypothetical protein